MSAAPSKSICKFNAISTETPMLFLEGICPNDSKVCLEELNKYLRRAKNCLKRRTNKGRTLPTQ